MQKAVQLQFINTVNSFLLDSFGRLVEDSLPLLANKTLRERLLRVTQDSRKFVTDQQAWNDLLGDSSRPIQWRSYNLSGMRVFFIMINVILLLSILFLEGHQEGRILEFLRSFITITICK